MNPLITLTAAGLALTATSQISRAEAPSKPNVLVFLADDVGYGDVGLHGNPHVQTPNIDRLAREGVQFTHFYSAPACSPTRAGLLTGRYHYRTKVLDVGDEVCKMSGEEITLAEVLRESGYGTAMFGKWHLGDNYPLRPADQGFEEVLQHNFCQITDDYPVGNSYFNPWLFHNGQLRKYEGYCLDVYADALIAYMRACADRKQPFFAYLPSTLAHIPLQIGEQWVKPYRDLGLKERTAKFYGMMANIDYNLGRILRALQELNIEENTLVVFTSDNGPCNGSIDEDRYMAGLRGMKTTVYENGIRVPCFMRWPARWKGGRTIDEITAYIDIFPTVLEACGVRPPLGPVIDGDSLHPILSGKRESLPDRVLAIQLEMTTSEQPRLYECFAFYKGPHKLVKAFGKSLIKASAYNKLCQLQNRPEFDPSQATTFELFDVQKDPGERHNIAPDNPALVEQMKREYQAWYCDVFASRGATRPLCKLNDQAENPAVFTTNKWLESKKWELIVETPGRYEAKIVWGNAKNPPQSIYFNFSGQEFKKEVTGTDTHFIVRDLEIPAGYQTMQAWADTPQNRLSMSIVLTKSP